MSDVDNAVLDDFSYDVHFSMELVRISFLCGVLGLSALDDVKCRCRPDLAYIQIMRSSVQRCRLVRKYDVICMVPRNINI